MGKLGGGGLNFSSDIDLIFARRNMARPGADAVNSVTPSFLRVSGGGDQKALDRPSPQWMVCLSGGHAPATVWRQRPLVLSFCRAGGYYREQDATGAARHGESAANGR